jgi:signal transduction histidine kinase
MNLFEQAIRSAHANDFVHNEALAAELASRFYAARGFDLIAQGYLRKARAGYLRWGAFGKVRQLDDLHPHLKEEEQAPGPTSTLGASVEHLDLATVIKVSQAVSGEIVLEKLIDTLMRTAIEHAGAERGLLILPQGAELRVEAEATTSGDTFTVYLPEASTASSALSESILHYVVRTQECVILEDASAHSPFSADAYIRRRRLVDANIIGIVIWNFEGEIIEANEAFLHILGFSREDLNSGRVRWTDLTPAEWRDRDERALAEIKATGTRVAALGELTASIAHEINQPLGAVVNNASACLRWLKAHNLEEARQSASLVIAEGHRAGQIISRVRALAKKTPPQKNWLEINETIGEVLAMVRNAAQRNRITSRTEFADDLPLILGDRIQLQQVILNLLINATEALSEVNEGPRELWVSSQKLSKNPAQGPHAMQTAESEKDECAARAVAKAEAPCVLITVRNSWPSLDAKGLDRLFDFFYTTKPQGLGMGLAISRSIIEAHGGQLWAKANLPRGAIFQFTLPLSQERMS